MIDYGKRELLGVSFDAVDLEAALERITYFAQQRRPYPVSALATHGTIEARRDLTLRNALNNFDLVLPDGQAVRWALNLLHGLDLPDKVPGPTVVDGMIERAAAEGMSVYFYGSKPETLVGIRDELGRRYGDRLVIHTTPSRFGSVPIGEISEIAAEINASGAQLCLVGLGCPRQERFTAVLGPHLAMPSLAVGAAFDYIAGSIDRAPDMIQRAGLEWAYRVWQDPRRLAKRYATTNTVFLAAFARQLVEQRLLRRPAAPATFGPRMPPWEWVDG